MHGIFIPFIISRWTNICEHSICESLNLQALLLNARKPSRRNLNAKLALKKLVQFVPKIVMLEYSRVLREELRPSQAAFAYGLTKKSFMKQVW